MTTILWGLSFCKLGTKMSFRCRKKERELGNEKNYVCVCVCLKRYVGVK